jgi:hypothetical protein
MTETLHNLIPTLQPPTIYYTGKNESSVPNGTKEYMILYFSHMLTLTRRYKKYDEKIQELERLVMTRSRVKHLTRYKGCRAKVFYELTSAR